MSQRAAGEKAYRAILREAFALAGREDLPVAVSEKLVAREMAGRQHLGLDRADALLAEEAQAWKTIKKTCPWCGGEPHD